MTISVPTNLEFRRVSEDDRPWALARLMHGSAGPARLSDAQVRAYADRLGVDFDYLWAGHEAGRCIGPVVLAVPRPGRSGILFCSDVRRRSEIGALTAAAGRLVEALPAGRIAMVQALLEPAEHLTFDALIDAGFSELAVLEYLQRSAPRRVEPPTWPAGVSIETYDEARHDAFAAALERSYIDTHDCPKLRGMRRTADVIAGHMSTGRFEPTLWTLVRLHGEPAGVQLLAPIQPQHCVELVYLGLAPAARGRGIGRALLNRAFAQCREQGIDVMTLAVDQSNAPALGLYRGAGFYRVARRRALVRALTEIIPHDTPRD